MQRGLRLSLVIALGVLAACSTPTEPVTPTKSKGSPGAKSSPKASPKGSPSPGASGSPGASPSPSGSPAPNTSPGASPSPGSSPGTSPKPSTAASTGTSPVPSASASASTPPASGGVPAAGLTFVGAVGTNYEGAALDYAFSNPQAIQLSAGGTLYVHDGGTGMLFAVTPSGQLSRVTGGGFADSVNGDRTTAFLSVGFGLTQDEDGNLFLAENGADRVRKIGLDGKVTTLAGTGVTGFQNGAAVSSQFSSPSSLAVAAGGALLIADADNNMIRRISTDGQVSTFAGAAAAGATDGTGAAARFSNPQGICALSDGTFLIVDQSGTALRRLSAAGVVTTVVPGDTAPGAFLPRFVASDGAGGYVVSSFGDNSVYAVSAAGVFKRLGAELELGTPTSLGVRTNGLVYAIDNDARRVMRIDPAAAAPKWEPIAGSGKTTSRDGIASVARFSNPGGVALAADGLLVADSAGERLCKVDGTGNVSTLLALPKGVPFAVAPLAAGGYVYSDVLANQVVRVAKDGTKTVFGSATKEAGDAVGTAASAKFTGPRGLAVGADGTIYIADGGNSRVKAIGADNLVTNFAGDGTFGLADGPRASAQFAGTFALCSTSRGLVVLDGSNAIRRVKPDGQVERVAGDPEGRGLVNGASSAARFARPSGVCEGADGTLFIADRDNGVIRTIAPDGTVATLTMPGAKLASPVSVTITADGKHLYVAEFNAHRIRHISR